MSEGSGTAQARREWIIALGVAVAIKLAWFAADSQMRYFLGDSGAYLFHATIAEAPPDRSYTYALLLRWFALPVKDLGPVLAVQTAFGVMTALLCFGIVRRFFAASFGLALAVAAIVATEPAQVFYERMVMAESPGTLCFLGALACGIAYLHRPHARWLVYGAILGMGGVSFRLSLLPVVLGMAALPPIVRHFVETGGARRYARTAAAVFLALFPTAAMQAMYRNWYDAHTPHIDRAAYIVNEGGMRLALVAPLVKPEHLEGYGLPADFLSTVVTPLHDPDMRETQLWSSEGIVNRLLAVTPDQGQKIARKVAIKALRGDPVGFLRMQAYTAGTYFDDRIALGRLADDLAVREADPGLVAWLHDVVNYESRGVHGRHTPAFLAFAHSRWWLTFCLFGLIPLGIAAVVFARREVRPIAVYVALVGAGMVAAQLLFSMIVSFRYLHAFPIIALLLAALVVDGVSRTARASSPSSGARPRPSP